MLVYFGYILLLMVLLGKNNFSGIAETVIKTTLIFSGILFLVTELLSGFHSLNLFSLAIFWGTFNVILIALLLRNQGKVTLRLMVQKIKFYYQNLLLKEKLLIGVLLILLCLLLAQGLLYPPNNWDSLTYHMSRIMYWIGNESVDYFPTHILRHLYQPPFAEYFILNINLLNGNDFLSNSVELFFLIQCLVVVYALLSMFQTTRLLKLLALFLVITIPAVELQSTTTKNDIVCAFFVLSSLFYSLKIFKNNSLNSTVFFGLSIGLGFITKGTAYVFMAPILALYGFHILSVTLKDKSVKPIGLATLAMVLALSLNVKHYSRNYTVNKSLLNIDDAEAKAYANETMNGKLLLSNLIKNSGLHLGYPIEKNCDSIIRNAHKAIGVSIDDKRLNYLGIPYQSARAAVTHEDYVTNTVHFILWALAFSFLVFHFLFSKTRNKTEMIIVIVLVAQILLFTGYLKWQPWHTRLHIPIFILSIIPIMLACQKTKWFKGMVWVSIPLLLYSFMFYFVYNNLRPIQNNPIYTKNLRIDDNRFKKYFANQPQLYTEYKVVLEELYDANPKTVGLKMMDWEYPLFNAYYYDHLQLVAIDVNNNTGILKQENQSVDLIVSTSNSPELMYNGIKYSNQNSNHLYIWLYKKEP
ncbi:MAG: hypothetical protein C0525_02035 [Flavobacterium sp.]|uniref:glycosyltransferase family 39 protein n=1 Tax=Flavobacterium sp. TaxID=239 RepID=UPI0025B95D84|nr:glycosyltransferase family 39 protein [Flavobacterium sp.]MBA4133482.1 hypothetical protein [Flavobacterium sp.]